MPGLVAPAPHHTSCGPFPRAALIRAAARVAAILVLLALGAPLAAIAQPRAGDNPASAAPTSAAAVNPVAEIWRGDPFETSRGSPQASPDRRDQVPKRRHTGFQALVRTLGSDFKAFPRRRSTWVILAIGAAADLAVHPADDEVTEELNEASARKAFAPGRVLGSAYFQGGTAAGTYLLGRYVIKPGGRKSNKITHVGFDLVRGAIVSQALTFGMKFAFRRDRPTGECCAFPSGHASAAFASAAILERHFGYRNAWPTFAIGGYVAASRMFDNRHFLSDVLFGSALGIASGWTIVGRHGRDDFAMRPVPTGGGIAIVGTWTIGRRQPLASEEH